MKYRYRFHPPKYALGEMEKFYSDMATKGCHLVKRGMFLSKFKTDEPADMKYRVEVISNGIFDSPAMPEEQMAVFRDCGWEYTDRDGYVYIFRAPQNSDTQEFYLDPAQQADTLKSMRVNLLLSALQFPVEIIAFALLGKMFGENLWAQVYLALITETAALFGLLAAIFVLMADDVVGTFHLWKLYRKMKKGVPLDHSPATAGLKFFRFAKALLLIFSAVTLFAHYSNKPIPMPAYTDEPYITIAETGDYSSRDNSSESEVKKSVSPFGTYYDCYEKVSGSAVTGWMYQEVMVLNNPDRADTVALAFMENATFAAEAKVFREIEIDGLDKAYYTGGLECVAIKDNKVAIFTKIFNSQREAESLLCAVAEKWNSDDDTLSE